MAKTVPEAVTPLTGNQALRVILVDDVKVCSSYQRRLTSTPKKIVKNFSSAAFGVPLIGERDDGSLWVVDGQQRIEALKLMGKKDFRANIFKSKGVEHEAEVFRLVNKNRTALSSLDLFKARLAEGDADAWKIKEAIDSEGFRLGDGRGTNKTSLSSPEFVIGAIQTFENVYRIYGDGPIIFALKVVKEAWPGDVHRTNGTILAGLMQFYCVTMEFKIDVKRLTDRLRGPNTTPVKILYSASLGVGSRTISTAEQFHKIYRKTRVAKPIE